MGIRILIVDDHGLLRAGLRALLSLEDDLEVVGEASDGRQSLELAASLQPDVILMDISLPDISGIEALRQIHVRYPEIAVLMLTVYEGTSLLRESMKAGAAGYILKKAVEDELIDAIRKVAKSEIYVHPAMTQAMIEEQPPVIRQRREVTLTRRELDILTLLARGYTNREIAEELHLSIRTAETHRANLMSKLDLHTRVDLVRFAVEQGIVKIS